MDSCNNLVELIRQVSTPGKVYKPGTLLAQEYVLSRCSVTASIDDIVWLLRDGTVTALGPEPNDKRYVLQVPIGVIVSPKVPHMKLSDIYIDPATGRSHEVDGKTAIVSGSGSRFFVWKSSIDNYTDLPSTSLLQDWNILDSFPGHSRAPFSKYYMVYSTMS